MQWFDSKGDGLGCLSPSSGSVWPPDRSHLPRAVPHCHALPFQRDQRVATRAGSPNRCLLCKLKSGHVPAGTPVPRVTSAEARLSSAAASTAVATGTSPAKFWGAAQDNPSEQRCASLELRSRGFIVRAVSCMIGAFERTRVLSAVRAGHSWRVPSHRFRGPVHGPTDRVASRRAVSACGSRSKVLTR